MSRLSQEQKAKIIALKEAKLSWNKISSQLNIPRSTIRSIWKKYTETNTTDNKSCTGRPKKFTDRDERNLVRLIKKNRKLSLRQLTTKFNDTYPSKMSLRTIRRILKRRKIKSYVAQKKFLLTNRHRSIRKDWWKQYKSWSLNDWKGVIFSDECKFGFSSDGKTFVKAHSSELHLPDCFQLQPTDRRSVMYWGCITFNGTGAVSYTHLTLPTIYSV